jgi:hypothetical protein
MKRTVKLIERPSGFPFEVDEDAHALIIRTYHLVYRIKQAYWFAIVASVVLLWYLGHVPLWVIPIVVFLLMLLNYILSFNTLGWLSKKTGLEPEVVYGIYLGYLRDNVDTIREELHGADRDKER